MRVYWCDIQPLLVQPEPFLRWCEERGIRLEKYLCLDDTLRHFAGLQMRRITEELDGPELLVNISHSGRLVVCSSGKTASGIDTEEILPTDPLPAEFFTAEEQCWIQTQSRPDRAFFRLWTRKESLIKARRKSLADILDLPSLVADGILLDAVDGLHIQELALLQEEYATSISLDVVDSIELISLSINQIFPN